MAADMTWPRVIHAGRFFPSHVLSAMADVMRSINALAFASTSGVMRAFASSGDKHIYDGIMSPNSFPAVEDDDSCFVRLLGAAPDEPVDGILLHALNLDST